ncbi:MAG: cell division protein ZapA [Rickettsiaceae bacterium]|nr:cell division protein ZapA [Rickettsiaceae bacterium]
MATIVAKINSKEFKVECPDSEKQDVNDSAAKIEKLVSELKEHNPLANTDKLLFLAAMIIQNNSANLSRSNKDRALEEELNQLILEIKKRSSSILQEFRR